jgi:hypothetical protein
MCKAQTPVNVTALDQAARKRCEDGSERYGQALFNILHSTHPRLANSLLGTDADPFFAESDRDPRLAAFWEKMLDTQSPTV